MASKRSFPSPSKGGKHHPTPARDKHSGRIITDQSGRYSGRDSKVRNATNGGPGAVGRQPERVYAFVTTGHTITPRTLKGTRIATSEKAFYPKEIFDSQAEYDASVDSVVARIRSGQVKARTPDE